MIQCMPWTSDDEVWTLALWAQMRCRIEWGQDLPAHVEHQQSWISNTLMHSGLSPEFLVLRTEQGQPLGLAMIDDVDWHNRSARLRLTAEPNTLERIDLLERTLRHLAGLGFVRHNLVRLWTATAADMPDHHDALSSTGFQLETRRRRALYRNGGYLDETIWGLLHAEWPAA